jgi:hypothetical protein
VSSDASADHRLMPMVCYRHCFATSMFQTPAKKSTSSSPAVNFKRVGNSSIVTDAEPTTGAKNAGSIICYTVWISSPPRLTGNVVCSLDVSLSATSKIDCNVLLNRVSYCLTIGHSTGGAHRKMCNSLSIKTIAQHERCGVSVEISQTIVHPLHQRSA